MAFETTRQPHDIIVEAKLYFDYIDVSETFYDLHARVATVCNLEETCHANCSIGEARLDIHLEDEVGDGWNSGSLGAFDYFWVAFKDKLTGLRRGNARRRDAVPINALRLPLYNNTLLGGFSRIVPMCLADGDYVLSTGFNNGRIDGGEPSESTWTFCGVTGILAESAHFRVTDGNCTATDGQGNKIVVTPEPTTNSASTPAPINGTMYVGGDDDDMSDLAADDDDGFTSIGGEEAVDDDNQTEEWVWFAVGFGMLSLTILVAGVGILAQNRGWFKNTPGAGAGAAAGVGGVAAGAPDPDFDEFAT